MKNLKKGEKSAPADSRGEKVTRVFSARECNDSIPFCGMKCNACPFTEVKRSEQVQPK